MECENTDGQRPSVFGPEIFSSTCILDMCTSKNVHMYVYNNGLLNEQVFKVLI